MASLTSHDTKTAGTALRLHGEPVPPAAIAVGAVVEVAWEDGEHAIYLIAAESCPEKNVIATDAPLARAIYGATTGESRTFCAGRRLRTVRIVRIEGAHDVA
jgi:transcription elongation GreA/GreB family factor